MTATFLFADLAGFTALTEAHGDERAADLAADFRRAVTALLGGQRAQLVKTIGDAAMIRCEVAAAAVRLGVRIVEDVGGRPGFPVVRVGMHTGPAAERAGDWFGATVNLAARIAEVAGGGDVLLSDATRRAAGDLADVTVSDRGRRLFRNVAAPVLLYAAERRPERSAGGLPIDPVCRMAVAPGSAASTLWRGGIRYYFCSRGCAETFAERRGGAALPGCVPVRRPG